MAGGAFNTLVVEFDAIVEAVWAVGLSEIEIFGAEPGITHRNRMIVGEVGADMFDRNVMRDTAVVALGAVHGVVAAVDAQMHRGVFATAPAVGAEDGHVDPHGAVVAREAQQANGAGCFDLVIERAAIIEVVTVLGGGAKTVPSFNAAKGCGVGAFLFRRNVAIDAGGAIVGEGEA